VCDVLYLLHGRERPLPVDVDVVESYAPVPTQQVPSSAVVVEVEEEVEETPPLVVEQEQQQEEEHVEAKRRGSGGNMVQVSVSASAINTTRRKAHALMLKIVFSFESVQYFYKDGQNLDNCFVANSAKRVSSCCCDDDVTI
jgi:hypothetical protein